MSHSRSLRLPKVEPDLSLALAPARALPPRVTAVSSASSRPRLRLARHPESSGRRAGLYRLEVEAGAPARQRTPPTAEFASRWRLHRAERGRAPFLLPTLGQSQSVRLVAAN